MVTFYVAVLEFPLSISLAPTCRTANYSIGYVSQEPVQRESRKSFIAAAIIPNDLLLSLLPNELTSGALRNASISRRLFRFVLLTDWVNQLGQPASKAGHGHAKTQSPLSRCIYRDIQFAQLEILPLQAKFRILKINITRRYLWENV